MVNTGFATLDLNGLEVETENNSVTIAGIYDTLDKFYNSYKPFLVTNYTSSPAGPPVQPGSPVIAQVTRPTRDPFYIKFLGHTGIIMLEVTSNNNVKVLKVYGYHNIYTPYTNNSIRTDENEDVNNEVK